MHFTMIDRRQIKRETKEILSTAHVSPKKMTALYLGISTLLSTSSTLLPSISLLDLTLGFGIDSLTNTLIAGTFVSILVTLMMQVLLAGYTMYCMGVRKGQEMGYSQLFDGFAFASKIIALMITEFLYIWIWSMLLVIPGIIAAYRYRYALLNLCENPDLSPGQAIRLSKTQTRGYKLQLVMLDLSYVPWMFLAQLPLFGLYGIAFEAPLLATFPLPAIWMQTLITSLWGLVIACHYLPAYRTSEISYFEISKSSSNTGKQDNTSQNKDIWE